MCHESREWTPAAEEQRAGEGSEGGRGLRTKSDDSEGAIVKTITLCTNYKINFREREHCRNRTDQGKCVVYSC